MKRSLFKTISLCLLLFCIIRCSPNKEEVKLTKVLEFAKENKIELQKVLDHYQAPKDALKLKAAKFLILSIPYHSYNEIDHRYDIIFERASKDKEDPNNIKHRRDLFVNRLRKHRKYLERNNIYSSFEKKNDIDNLKSEFIINNIELAFKAWYKIPEKERASFEDFCNFILPYRSTNEPLETDSRLYLHKKYSWVYDEFNKGVKFKTIVDKVIRGFDYKTTSTISRLYPLPLSISQIEKSRVGLCDDGVNYFVNVFRSLGIHCSKDYISHWGNHHSVGHSWINIKYGDKEYATNFMSENLKEAYKEESIPKISRVSFEYKNESGFSPFGIDVTSDYVKTINIKVENVLENSIKTPVLLVFDKHKKWKIIDKGEYKWSKSEFLNVGVNVLYLAASMNKDGIINPTNYPFYIDNNKQVNYFKPQDSIVKSAIFLRKYGLSSPRIKNKINWMKDLNGSKIQVSNDKSFEEYVTLHEIKNLKSTQIQKIEINNLDKFKFIRFKSNNKKEVFLAKLAFYDDDKKLHENVFSENVTLGNKRRKTQGALDHVPLTYSGGKDFTIGMEFNKPKKIKMIEYQARNDDNHIKVGNNYELFYWDKEWQSLGMKKANDTVLYYDVPANSLFWLKNHTKGKEEHVFTINKNKKQQWLGFDNDFQ